MAFIKSFHFMSVLNDGQCLCGNKFAVAESLAL